MDNQDSERSVDAIRLYTAADLQAAQLAERERCAVIAESHGDVNEAHELSCIAFIAAAIRTQGPSPTPNSEYVKGLIDARNAACDYCWANWPLEVRPGVDTREHKKMGAWRSCSAVAINSLIRDSSPTKEEEQ